MKMRHFLAAAAVACVPMIAVAANVEFVNQSAWEIHEVYFSPASQSDWGEDYLGKEVLEKGDALTLSDVKAGTWDVMIVDEDGDKCVLEDVAISSSDRWVITDDDLLACQAGS
ncbi:MAG: hypothetical protein KA735_13095 [Burkholderiaceae bacterium]|nr:hypothetical protein [Burkholderiaceae bacterium]